MQTDPLPMQPDRPKKIGKPRIKGKTKTKKKPAAKSK